MNRVRLDRPSPSARLEDCFNRVDQPCGRVRIEVSGRAVVHGRIRPGTVRRHRHDDVFCQRNADRQIDGAMIQHVRFERDAVLPRIRVLHDIRLIALRPFGNVAHERERRSSEIEQHNARHVANHVRLRARRVRFGHTFVNEHEQTIGVFWQVGDGARDRGTQGVELFHRAPPGSATADARSARAWQSAIASTVAAHCAHAAFVISSAACMSRFVCGAIAGNAHRVTGWHALKVITGAGEIGACLQAGNVNRQDSISPCTRFGRFIEDSPGCGFDARLRRADLRTRRIEPPLQFGVRLRIRFESRNRLIACRHLIARSACGLLCVRNVCTE
nr:MAG TPA: hypothetical protein [Caudoviricetes sp.]